MVSRSSTTLREGCGSSAATRSSASLAEAVIDLSI
jgi:hypothetical protein